MCALVIGWAVYRLSRDQTNTQWIVAIVAGVLTALMVMALARLAGLLLRDFVAPLQWYCDLTCGAAVQRVGALIRAHPGIFLLYLVAKFLFALVVSMLAGFLGCLVCACCCISWLFLLPVISQALLQPLYYFERRWSLELLRQLGFSPPAAESGGT
jgi:hypothetical protein